MPGTIDQDALTELSLYIENTSELYNQKKSIVANIKRKLASGKYDATKAPKLWLYWVDAGARRYVKEFGGTVPGTFSKPTREALAREIAKEMHAEILRGEW